jgi:glutamate carboxypeptidase
MTVRTLRLLPLAVALTAPLPAPAQQLSPEERRIVAWVDAHTGDAVSLLERIVNLNSGTLNPEGVRAVGKVLGEELDGIGMRTRWVEMPDSLNRAGHLFAETTGGKRKRGKRVLLIGHLDTVFEEDSPFQRFERQGSRAKGPGVADMKGGDVVMVYALKALHAAGVLDGAQVIAAFTGDEESAGRPLEIARGDLIEAAKRSDVALEFETGSRDEGQEYAVIARRSSTGWRLDVKAKPGHSSGIFQERAGSGAIFEAARVLSAFHQELRGEPNLTFNPGVIVGGTEVRYDAEESRGTAFGKSNVIAETAVATGDLRTLTDEQLQRTRERMRAIVARSLPHATSTLTFSEGYPSMPPTPGNQALLERLNGVNRDLGLPPVLAFDPGRRGAADVSFVAPYVDALAGLGVHGSGAHSAEESIDLETLPTVIKRAALLIYRLTR